MKDAIKLCDYVKWYDKSLKTWRYGYLVGQVSSTCIIERDWPYANSPPYKIHRDKVEKVNQ